jgi:hypothetical protein
MKFNIPAIAACSFCVFLFIPFNSIYAQYVSPYNSNGNVKSVEQRRYDESKSKQKTYTPKPDPKPATRPVPAKTTPSNTNPSTVAQQNISKPKNSINGYSYGKIEAFHEGFAVVRTSDKVFEPNVKFGFIDESGKPVVPMIYDYAAEFKDGLAMVNQADKYGFIDKTGSLVIPLIYEESGFYFREGSVGLKQKGKWGFLDAKGNTIVPFIYDEVKFFREGLAAVKLNDKWGFVDKTGHVAVDIKYDKLFDFNQGISWVKSGNTWGIIDLKGVEIVPSVYADDDIMQGRISAKPADGKMQVHLNGQTMFYDKSGKNVTPAEPETAKSVKSKEDRLKELKNLFVKELITKEEYAKARQKILDEK